MPIPGAHTSLIFLRKNARVLDDVDRCPKMDGGHCQSSAKLTTPMKPFRLLAIVAALAFSILSHDSAAAGKGGKMKKPKPTPVPEKSKAFSEIKRVSGDTITIEHSKATTKYRMSDETQIQIDGNRASAANLKPGMHVEVTPSSINPTVLRSVAATTAPKN